MRHPWDKTLIFIAVVVTQIYTCNNVAQNKIHTHKCSRGVLIAVTLDKKKKNTWREVYARNNKKFR